MLHIRKYTGKEHNVIHHQTSTMTTIPDDDEDEDEEEVQNQRNGEVTIAYNLTTKSTNANNVKRKFTMMSKGIKINTIRLYKAILINIIDMFWNSDPRDKRSKLYEIVSLFDSDTNPSKELINSVGKWTYPNGNEEAPNVIRVTIKWLTVTGTNINSIFQISPIKWKINIYWLRKFCEWTRKY